MVQVTFDFDTEGQAHEDAFLTPYELEQMVAQTQHALTDAVRRKLGDIRCDEHDQEPTITITGRYDHETEQMAIDYHVDTCCKRFMARVVKLLNTGG